MPPGGQRGPSQYVRLRNLSQEDEEDADALLDAQVGPVYTYVCVCV
jgi:hypothetical protein